MEMGGGGDGRRRRQPQQQNRNGKSNDGNSGRGQEQKGGGGGEGRVVVDPNSREGPADGGDEVLGAREVKDSIGGRWTNGVWAALQ
jgi:hypothetical protein